MSLKKPVRSVSQIDPSGIPLLHLFDRFKISAGELGQKPKVLGEQLSTIFRVAYHRKAILLDEADLFVQSRSFVNPYNTLVSVFLRRLECY